MMTLTEWIGALGQLTSTESDLPRFWAKVERMKKELASSLPDQGLPATAVKALLLKVSNQLLCRFQYTFRHDLLIGSPAGLIVDPANGCPLALPGLPA